MPVAVKRVYESTSRSDGTRVLVDRLWPRGLRKSVAHQWLRDLAPSNTLRKWFHGNLDQWPAFRKRYLKELAQPEAQADLQLLYRMAQRKKRLTLLFASKNVEHNNAVVLKELLDGMRKPPTGTGPAGIRSTRQREAAAQRRRRPD